MTVSKALNNSTNTEKRQSYYMEVRGRPGRIYIRHLEFGSRHQLLVDGRVSLRPLDSPLTIYPSPGFRADPLFSYLSVFYQRAEAANASGGRSESAVIPECVIGVETKENGQVSLDIIYRLKEVQVIYQIPFAQIPRMVFSFFNSEKVWRTWY